MKVHAICTNFWIFSLSPVEKTNINQPIPCFVVNLTFNQMPQRVFTFQDLGKLEQYSVGVFNLEVKLDGLQQDPLHGHHFLLPTNRPVVSCQGVANSTGRHFKKWQTKIDDHTVFVLDLFLYRIVKWSIYNLKRHDMVFHKIRSKCYYWMNNFISMYKYVPLKRKDEILVCLLSTMNLALYYKRTWYEHSPLDRPQTQWTAEGTAATDRLWWCLYISWVSPRPSQPGKDNMLL